MLVQYFNQQFSFAQNLDFCIRILAACICGACIGVERARHYKEAGIKTHIIVCCGAAMCMILSKYGFADLSSAEGELFPGTRGADSAKLAAQVVSGISFLGAGVIYRHDESVKGLTTAAGIWTTAVIGLAAGAGMYSIAIVGTVIISLLQAVIRKVACGSEFCRTYKIQFIGNLTDEFQNMLSNRMEEWEGQIIETKLYRQTEKTIKYEFIVRLNHEISYVELKDLVDMEIETDRMEGAVIQRL